MSPTILDPSQEVCLESDAGQNHNIKISNKSFKKYGKVKIFNDKLKSCKVKSKLNLKNACYCSVQNHLLFLSVI
jgi:hypothetical protein